MKSKNLLIIFTKNPELGKCKTRLAKSIGDTAALEVYKKLLQHTAKVTQDLSADKVVFNNTEPIDQDDFSSTHFSKKNQRGDDLGEKMSNAFQGGFQNNYEKVVIIGSDLYDLQTRDIDEAFLQLTHNDYVIGPAKDGGYYLLGMKKFTPEVFQEINWSTATVLKETLHILKNKKVALLTQKNDIDTIDDIKNIEVFQQYINS
ncbi:TIGR04282 family arsenosugar biosynthesis glycosyltransferase [Mesonia mobilis]|uniref:TIGR04282 family arsenosugar biosynthesis glycosyltransferase n=1 Tax=Mesonia mobilis TaxID=369791 RepID=UPI0026F1C35F|nr:TIGR04282 family arsenosugar biosynthesis glycosyltransferase [Mesonia mobilis]